MMLSPLPVICRPIWKVRKMARAVFGNHTRMSNPTPSGIPQGSPGGVTRKLPGIKGLKAGDEVYLWILLFIEVAAMGFLRKHFRRYHGG